MKSIRIQLKKQAEKNEQLFHEALGPDFENIWNLLEVYNKQINICVNKSCNDEKRNLLMIMLWNSMSDIFCCMDALERGHEQTVFNNLRMILENFCFVFEITQDKTYYIWEEFKKSRYSTQKSVGEISNKFKKRFKDLYTLYRHLSGISHQSQFYLIARQLVSRPTDIAIFSHLKPINQEKFKTQINILLIIIFLSRSIAELAEEFCIDLLDKPYFGEKTQAGWQKGND